MLSQNSIVTFLATIDADAARTFYSEVLQLELVADEPMALVYRLHQAELRISKLPSFTPEPFTVLGWRVPDLAAAVDTLRGRGVVFKRFEGIGQDERDIATFADGGQVAWFGDPDGNLLSLTQQPGS